MSITVNSRSKEILSQPWTKGPEISARIRLATEEEKQNDWKVLRCIKSPFRFLYSVYNLLWMISDKDVIKNMTPAAESANEYHFEHLLPTNYFQCFIHPTAIQAIFRHYRCDKSELAPFLEEGPFSTQVFLKVVNEIFPGSKLESDDFIMTASVPGNKKIRAALRSFFTGPKRKEIQNEICSIAKSVVSDWATANRCNGEVNLNRAVRLFTSQVLIQIFIGNLSLNSDLIDPIDTLILRVGEAYLNQGPTDPKKWEEAKKALSASIDKSMKKQSFAEALKNNGLSPNEIRGVILILFIAGYETTATSLINTIIMLAQDTEKQEQVAKEAIQLRLVESYRPGIDLPTLRDVIKESLKDFTPVYITTRTPKDDLIMEIRKNENRDEVLSYYIPKTDLVAASSKFSAQKHGEEDKLYENKTPLFWYPFGGGKHECPGKDLANMEMILFIATLLQHYKISTTFKGKPTQFGLCFSDIKESVGIELSPH